MIEGFRGWEAARTGRSLERDLALSAERHCGGYIHLAWGSPDRVMALQDQAVPFRAVTRTGEPCLAAPDPSTQAESAWRWPDQGRRMGRHGNRHTWVR
ncbi:DUF6228 family protein [Streptomyces sp. QH1-20]|uniref:DUF6228 family protein n=1 Tax=Streptomyces sp. QH1-20 TaxID=3240934 RepID=UPI0035139243